MSEKPDNLPASPQACLQGNAQILAQCEAAIDNGIKVFLRVADALITIKRLDLWRGEYAIFADYCQRRWRLGTSTTYNYLRASALFEDAPARVRDSITLHKAVELSRLPVPMREEIMSRKEFHLMSVRDIKAERNATSKVSKCPHCGASMQGVGPTPPQGKES